MTRALPWHLTAAWLTAALLYFAHPSWLPSPFAAFLLSTLVGLAGAGLLAVLTHRTPGSSRASAPVPLPAAAPLRATAPFVAPPIVRPPAAPADLAPADTGRYRVADPDERQCPRCGGFEVQAGSAGSAQCQTCRHGWRLDHQGVVAVRSWLHRR